MRRENKLIVVINSIAKKKTAREVLGEGSIYKVLLVNVAMLLVKCAHTQRKKDLITQIKPFFRGNIENLS